MKKRKHKHCWKYWDLYSKKTKNSIGDNLYFTHLDLMAKTALISKQAKLYQKKFGTAQTSDTKYYNRCRLCGRSRSYMREFGICRVCFRKYAREGLIMGVKKASR
jgi:small subunit ribosomal protein S14